MACVDQKHPLGAAVAISGVDARGAINRRSCALSRGAVGARYEAR